MRSEKQIRKVIKYLEKYIEDELDYPPQISWHKHLVFALEYALEDSDVVGASESFYKKYGKYIKEN